MHALVAALRDPASTASLDGRGWSALISVARAEVLLGTLACRLAQAGVGVPPAIAPTLDAARISAQQAQIHALWEAEMCCRALEPLGIVPVLLKGTAYAAAGLPNASGRQIGDLDILVPRDRLAEVEGALLAAGWEWVKDDPYDQAYYRDHMHELPPLIHRERDRMIDVHHTILPLTAKPTPDAVAMIASSKPLPSKGGVGVGGIDQSPSPSDSPTPNPSLGREGGMVTLSPTDMICHAAAHLLADGDLAGGLRNLWDIDRLFRYFGAAHGFWPDLAARADQHQLTPAVHRAARLAHRLYATPIPADWASPAPADRLFAAHLLTRDDWGRESRPLLRLGFYIRAHLLRMPLPMLLKHLWVKWRRG